MNYHIWVALAFYLLLAIKGIIADDGFVGSNGGNVYLMKSSGIKMIKEYVNVKMLKDSCEVYCEFWFLNEQKDTVASVAFPNFYYSPAEGTIPIKQFQCFQDGRPIKVDTINKAWIDGQNDTNYSINDKNHKSNKMEDGWGESWFLWKSSFEKGKITKIQNKYIGKYGVNTSNIKYIAYVLGTGRSWAGSIGEGRIVFNHSAIATNLFIRYGYNKSNIKANNMDDSTVFTFTDYNPPDRDQIYMSFYCYWSDAWKETGNNKSNEDLSYLAEASLKEIANTSSAQEMINEIYARHGYIFKNEGIRNKYLKHKWYVPNESFSMSILNKYEQFTIEILKKIK